MARFPLKEAEVMALAEAMEVGLAANVAIESNDNYNTARCYALCHSREACPRPDRGTGIHSFNCAWSVPSGFPVKLGMTKGGGKDKPVLA